MTALPSFVCSHPYFSMLVFTCIGFLLRGMRRLNLTAVRIVMEDLELALDDHDQSRARDCLERLKAGFGWK